MPGECPVTENIPLIRPDVRSPIRNSPTGLTDFEFEKFVIPDGRLPDADEPSNTITRDTIQDDLTNPSKY